VTTPFSRAARQNKIFECHLRSLSFDTFSFVTVPQAKQLVNRLHFTHLKSTLLFHASNRESLVEGFNRAAE
jgi:hypothetical protein